MSRPIRLIEMTPADAAACLRAHPALILPAGALWPRAPHLPLGSDALLLDRLADDLSARLGLPRAPLLPFGVHTPRERRAPGGASLTRKTLHRTMNELIASWEEEAGVRTILVLTAHAEEPHQEALSTIRSSAVVKVIDILELPAAGRGQDNEGSRGDAATDLLLHLRPEVVALGGTEADRVAASARGRTRYAAILDQLVRLVESTRNSTREAG